MLKKLSTILCTLVFTAMVFTNSVSAENNNNYNEQDVNQNYDVRDTAANNAADDGMNWEWVGLLGLAGLLGLRRKDPDKA
ncbi:WGxxGxxG family protein [Thalassobacillus sp. CUG 92003]|uniref:WGxxGxxG family protein n=1 Tax=Thalassobacillus sp. CUG 92003 TaxID=2736641 RepID=UPI0015E75E57|nr:WGxxGxxG family protein [Thalassobacillus sp. CUG 92003]